MTGSVASVSPLLSSRRKILDLILRMTILKTGMIHGAIHSYRVSSMRCHALLRATLSFINELGVAKALTSVEMTHIL